MPITPAALEAAYASKLRRIDERIASQKKQCSRCREILPFDDFGRAAKSVDGLRSYCRPCMAAYIRERSRERRAAERAAATAAAATQATLDALARRDAAERARPALRKARLIREQVERDRAEVAAWAAWRRGLTG